MIPSTIRVALALADSFESRGIRYLVGGSLASSLSGEPRSTLDVDLIVELTEKDVDGLVASLSDDYYVDADSLRRAVRERSSTNLVHLATSTKVDLFMTGGTPLDREQMNRRLRVRVSSDPDAWLYVYTPEDILLQKLRWYRLGNETSDRQWRDVLGIIMVQGDRLDEDRLRAGAGVLGVSDLLDRALGEARDA